MDSLNEEKSYNQVTFSGEPLIDYGDDLSSQTRFLCPGVRIKSSKNYLQLTVSFWEIDSSPHFHGIVQQNELKDYNEILDLYKEHNILPLFWCNNKEDFLLNSCAACDGYNNYGQNYYFCGKCCRIYHKECVESPPEIKHSYHPKHSLKLFTSLYSVYCIHCRKEGKRRYYQPIGGMVYRCTMCKFNMHSVCAMGPNSFVLDQSKRHEHPLAFLTRKVSLDCNVCGLTNELHPTYVCLKCNFIAHSDCAYFPSVIRISRHNHRVSFALSFPPREWACGICGKNVDSEYGGYICKKCEDYVVHSRCATREDIWDQKELEGIREEDDIEQNIESFKIIREGIILHICHEHLLRIETSKVYDERKICQACVIPIYEGDFYSCMECDFILHITCANFPPQKYHPLHPHSLTLIPKYRYDDSCAACFSLAGGFIYICREKYCKYKLDVRCASISVPFNYRGHEHPLFLTFKSRRNSKMSRMSSLQTSCALYIKLHQMQFHDMFQMCYLTIHDKI